MRRSLIFLLLTIAVAVVTLDAARRQAPAVVTANGDAVRLNNLGVASMNQQKFEAALKYFQDASARDASFPLAKVNEAIADLALQRYEPAQALLEAAVKTDDKNARAWYNLGLLQKGLGNADASLAAFTRAAELAPADAHARYFVGLIASQSQKYDDAIAAFTKALEADPFLVSAEFGLARAYQRSGKPDDAKTHMDRFTRMTQSKVASAMSLAYGDQGPLSLAAAAQLPPAALTAIPVTFVVDSRLAIGDRAGVLGDFDNDEHDDLATVSTQGVRLFHDDGHGNFVDVTEKVGLPATIEGAVGVTFVDVDHDGDLDLIVTGSHTRLFRNNGNSTFTDVTVERGFDIPNTVGVVASDLNNDRAIDLVLTGEKTTILLNPREGAFKKLDAFGATAPTATRGVVAFDFDKDGWMDLAFTSGAAPALTVWRNVKGQSFERVDLPASTLTEGFGLTAVDYDNDGWLDLVAAGAGPKGGVLQAWRNVQGRFTDDSSRVGMTAVSLKQPRQVFAGDLDGDNDADLIVTDAVAAPVRLRNDGGNASHAIRLALTGLNDNRSGIGTKVEVQAGAIWQKFETTAASSLLGSHAGEILAGVGQATEVDVVRLLWPTGVVQDEVQLAANAPHKIQQIDRRGSSCPILFSWNGSRFEFISDTIGPAVIGHWVAPGEYDTPDTDEFVKVDGSKVRVKDGVLSFHFTEPMEEINYLDQVKLFVVDHPEGTEANPNEYFAAEPPFPADRTLVSRGARLPPRRVGRQGPRPASRPARGGPQVRRDVPGRAVQGLRDAARARARPRRRRYPRTAAPADARLHRLLHRDVDVRGRSGQRESHRPVSRGPARRRIVEARQRRHRLPRRPASHDDGGPHGKAPRRHAAHPHLDEPEDLLGPGARGHDARGVDSVHADRDPARACFACVPRLPARDPRHADGRHPVRLQRRQPHGALRAASRLLHEVRRRHAAPSRRRGSLRHLRIGR